MIDNATKEQIKTHLINFCAIAGSDNKAAGQLGVSNAYISQIKNNKSDALSDDMWRKISKQLGLNFDEGWNYADTKPSIALMEMFDDSRIYRTVYSIVMHPGGGKTCTLDRLRLNNRDVFYVKCISEMTPKELYMEILQSMGKTQYTGSVLTLLRQVENEVERREHPVIIVDEIEKVPNKVLFQFIDIYNVLFRKCGLVLLGTPNLKTRIETNRTLLKLGYNEIASRVGVKFVFVPPPDAKDAASVIRKNGISDMIAITSIVNDSIDNMHGGVDMRRVERLVHKEKITKEKAA